MKQVVLLDFCGTVVDFQTFNPFILYILKKKKRHIYIIYSSGLFKNFSAFVNRIWNILGISDDYYKKRLVRATKGIAEHDFLSMGREYYDHYVNKRIINVVIKEMLRLQNLGCEIWIVSGGLKYYIDCFARLYGIKNVITTEIEMRNGKSTGHIGGEDCIGVNKVQKINEFLQNERLINVSFREGITDSVMDVSMLKLCEDKLVISKGEHQEWVTKPMRELIY